MAMTAEERRARNRERMQRVRAEERCKREAERAADRAHVAANAPRVIREAVESALAAMTWLAPSDGACVAQARWAAREVDEGRYAGDVQGVLAAQRFLSRVLHDLAGSPVVRMQRELRSLSAGVAAE